MQLTGTIKYESSTLIRVFQEAKIKAKKINEWGNIVRDDWKARNAKIVMNTLECKIVFEQLKECNEKI